MYMPHGVIMDQFWPTSPESFLKSPPPALESLRPVLNQCLHDEGHLGRADRAFQWGASCAGAVDLAHGAACRMRTSGTSINIAISADQIVANYVGALTSLPSLELATMPQTHKENQEGLNEGYYSHCSFRSPRRQCPQRSIRAVC